MTDHDDLLTNADESSLSRWDALPFLEKVTKVAPGIIYVFNQKTMSNEYSNHSLPESLGYSIAEIQHLGAEFMPSLCHPDDLPNVYAHFGTIQALADGAVAEIEYRMRHRDGHWVWLLSKDTVFDRDTDGTVLRHIGVAIDISAQKHAEAIALRETRLADATNQELRTFAYAMSHDLKSPSNTLAMLLSELGRSIEHGDSEETAEMLALSNETVSRMQRLIEDVLRYTRIIGCVEATVAVDLNKTVADVLNDLSAEIRAASVKIDLGELPSVHGTESQLRILFQNLVTNAIRYRAPAIDPVIGISSTVTPDGQAAISVSDNGIGIDTAKHEHIFKLFARLHREQEFPGSGLGLAICKRVATNLGGTISVDSEPGKGSVFTVTLPQ